MIRGACVNITVRQHDFVFMKRDKNDQLYQKCANDYRIYQKY